MTSLRILLVEDDADTAEALTFWLETDGFQCQAVGTCREAMQVLELGVRAGKAPPDAIILDLMLPDGDGAAIGEVVARMLPQCPIVIHSAAPSSMLAEAGERSHAAAVLRKPCECARIAVVLREAIETRRAAARTA